MSRKTSCLTKGHGMADRVRSFLVMVLVALASASCAQSRLDTLMAEQPGLAGLDSEVEQALRTALLSASPQRRDELALEQRRWRDGREEACLDPRALGDKDTGITRLYEAQCLRKRMEERIARLKDEPARGKPMVAEESDDLCRLALARDQLTWMGRDGSSRGFFRDRFTYTLPHSLSQPSWTEVRKSREFTVMKADTLGEFGGKAGTLFLIHGHLAIQPPWLAVIRADEAVRFETELLSIMSSRATYDMAYDVAALMRRLGGEAPASLIKTIDRAVWDGLWLYTLPFEQSAGYRSAFFPIPRPEDADAPPPIRAHLVIKDGKAFVVADNGHGTVSLFQADSSDGLRLKCRHVAAASWLQQQIETLDPNLPCPPATSLTLRPIPWRNPGDYPGRTFLDLPDWGGRRPLVRVQSAHGYIFPHVFAGTLDASTVEPPAKRTDRPADQWAPLFAAIGHDEVEIMMSGQGAYVVARDYPQPRDRSQEPPTTYYRIKDNGLAPVCRTKDRTIPPAGYPSARQ
jgi:uncharacterized protein YecT (DUF1311 family)